eukprot:TRINITY_DN21971_c0_g2_i1.p1 TRINITY_DN21971_c0_g2~~TRINITY_DN21971_c0_g2_i1.p1  ORF type:complete len:487 (-),score=28.59 TRINITY_DN21971_c0_g2_i1:58-1518(-)
MKTEQTLGGGTLKESFAIVDLYARYLVRYVQEFNRSGIHLDYLTLQNEPGHGSCAGMPCMLLDPSQANLLALYFTKHMRACQCGKTKLLAYDHNWDVDYQQYITLLIEKCLTCLPLWFMCLLFGLAVGRSIGFSRSQRSGSSQGSSDSFETPTRHTPRNPLQSVRRLRVNSDPGPLTVSLVSDTNGTIASYRDVVQHGSSLCAIVVRANVVSARRHAARACCRCRKLARCLSRPKVLWIIAGLALAFRVMLWACLYIAGAAFGQFTHNIGVNYPIELLDMSGGFVFAGVAWHCYGGRPSAMQNVADRFSEWEPPLEQHMTECSGGSWSGSWVDSFVNDQKLLFIGGALNSGQSVIRWNLALDENSGPHCSGYSCCKTCRGVVTVPSHATSIANVTFNVDFYGLAHHSAFVSSSGLTRRISANISGYSVAYVHAVAYLNPDGYVVLVALNEQVALDAFISVRDVSSNCTFEFVLPPGLVTFRWKSER